jgi:hypothetical protein
MIIAPFIGFTIHFVFAFALSMATVEENTTGSNIPPIIVQIVGGIFPFLAGADLMSIFKIVGGLCSPPACRLWRRRPGCSSTRTG